MPDKHAGEDRYELVLDLVEHPEKYTADQIAALLSDPETRRIYNLLCKTDAAIESARPVNVDAEWLTFTAKHAKRPRRRFMPFVGNRAASIAVIVISSIVAVAAGIALTKSVLASHENITDTQLTPTTGDAMLSADVVNTESADTVAIASTKPVLFEDATLLSILNTVASIYDVEVKVNNNAAASLHLYYRLDPSLTLEQVIDQLNTFEQINISRHGKTITID